MNYVLLLVICFLLSVSQSSAQTFSKKVVFLKDKGGTLFTLSNPSAYLSNHSVERRNRYNIAVDSTDLPVLQRYVDSIAAAGTVTILGKSKWLNAVIIQTTDNAALAKINSFSFVVTTTNAALRKVNARVQNKFSQEQNTALAYPARVSQSLADTFNYGSAASQILIHNGQFLHNIGARGQGMRMAFLDAGYFGFATNRFFDSARARNQLLGTRDFVTGNNSVNEDDAHGMSCFSIVAGYLPGTYVGSCTEAGYFLLRTEDAFTEQIIEEYNWVMGAEYADSAGVDVISSSLGYSTFDEPLFNHTYAHMNGNSTIISRMADAAAKKGMLVVTSAGNSGNDSWKFITAPADGDSVLSIGAVNNSGVIAAFSSFGPTSDGQIKPDVVSVGFGTALSNSSGNVAGGNGTSFSCPNMAGLTTCLWQLFPEFNNWKIITTLRQSSDRFLVPHEQYGYGLPNMKKAFGILVSEASTMNASLNNFKATLNWNSKDIASMRYEVERKLPNETSFTKIKTVAVSVTTFGTRNYNWDDVITNSPAGTVTYRIRQVIDTSAAGFDAYYIDSATVILTTAISVLDRTGNSKFVQLFPNPVQSTITVKLTEQTAVENFTLQIFNQQGQLLQTQNFNKPSGEFLKPISVSKLPSGNYILVLFKDGKQYASREFVKQ